MKKFLLLISLTLTSYSTHAGFLEGFTTVVGGHFNDLMSRFEDDQIIEGDIVARTKFREEDRGQRHVAPWIWLSDYRQHA